MESKPSQNTINSTVTQELLDYYGYSSTIAWNKYFLIDCKKNTDDSCNTVHKSKNTLSEKDWFERLDIQQRIESISTVATDNMQLVYDIKDSLNQLEEKYNTIDESEEQGLSNEEYLSKSRTSSSLNNAYYSQNSMYQAIFNLLKFKIKINTIEYSMLIINKNEFGAWGKF